MFKLLYAPIRYKIMTYLTTKIFRQFGLKIHKYYGKYSILSTKFSKDSDIILIKTSVGVDIALIFNMFGFLKDVVCSAIYVNGEPSIFLESEFLRLVEVKYKDDSKFVAQYFRNQINEIEKICK